MSTWGLKTKTVTIYNQLLFLPVQGYEGKVTFYYLIRSQFLETQADYSFQNDFPFELSANSMPLT